MASSMAACALSTEAEDWSSLDFHSWTVAWLAKSFLAERSLALIFRSVVVFSRQIGGEGRLRPDRVAA